MKRFSMFLLFLTTSLASAQTIICSTDGYLTNPLKWCWEKNGNPTEPDPLDKINNWIGLTYAGGNLPFPFDQNNQVGVYTLDRCRREDGWVLYDRRLHDNDHYDRVLAKITSQASDINRIPYFSLYNRRTGVLKTFIFKGKNSIIDHAGYLQINVGISRSGLSYSGAQGITSIDSREISLPVKTPNTDQEVIKYVIKTSEINKWIIIDTEIGYDPYLINPGTISGLPINIEYSIFSVKESAITLSGTITTPTTPTQQPSFFTGLFMAGKNAATAGGLGFFGPIASTVGINVLNTLTSVFSGEKREDGKPIDWDKAISSGFKDALDAKVWGKVPWVSAFTQLSASKTTFSKQSVDLKGTITETPKILDIKIPLPGADIDEYPRTERPYFFYSNPGEDLGLFSFERNPVMKMQSILSNSNEPDHHGGTYPSIRYYTFSLEDVRRIIKINPNAPMNLKEVKIQILDNSKWSSDYFSKFFKEYKGLKYTEWSNSNSFLGIQTYMADSFYDVDVYTDPYLKILLVFTPKDGGEDFVVVKTLKCDYKIESHYSWNLNFPFNEKYILQGTTVEGPGLFNEASGITRQWKITGLAYIYADYITTTDAIETSVNGLAKVEFQSIGDMKPTIDGIRPTSLKNLGNDGSYTKWTFYVRGGQRKVAWTVPGTLRNIKIMPIPFVSTVLEPLLF